MHHTHPVFIVLLAAFVAPLLAEIRVGFRLPVVVLEIVLGVLIGPQILNLANPDEFFDVMKGFGTAAVMFMAGMEIDFEQIRGRPLSLALQGWVVSLVLALLLVGVLHVICGRRADDGRHCPDNDRPWHNVADPARRRAA